MRRTGAWVAVLTALVVVLLGNSVRAQAQTPPFAAVQYGTNGCIEVGVRPDPPYNQPKPFIVPAGYDITSGYPAFGYDPAGYTPTSGTNSCRYNFRDPTGTTVVGSAYCVQWAAGQRTGTGYDPEPWDGTIRNAGYVRRILAEYWPVANAPAVPSTNPTVMNRQRSGTVAMAIHYFTDGVVMPPNYQDQALYNVVRTVVTEVLAKGPMTEPADPTPTIDGPDGGSTGGLIGPYAIGADATGDVTVTVDGAQAYLDGAGTQPFTGGPLAPGTQLWLSSASAGTATIHAEGPVVAQTGTLMVPDPAYPVQQMMLAEPLTLNGEASKPVTIVVPPISPHLFSQVSADQIEVGAAVTDRFTVVGLPSGRQAVLTVSLYGPVSRPATGCAAVDWADASVERTFDPVMMTAEGSYTTSSVVLSEPGCYSFGGTLDPDVGDPVVFPPGDPAETVLVIRQVIPPVLTIATQTSEHTVDPGTTVSDRVTVAGLLPGRTVTITPRVLGPVTPGPDGSCASVEWLTARPPVAATLPVREVDANGAFQTQPVTLTAPGCYLFVATAVTTQLTGGEIPVDHGLANPDEMVLVRDVPVLPNSHGPRPVVAVLGALSILIGFALFSASRRVRPQLR
ncbi:hypothetical protein AB0M47_28350 [Hamadaea sp. NPDC051192]|uniref:hypothetical protein n=1 Tax=Hamadaea sp. NPDC051192 TaxID=3154940 RepID=UPI00343B506C